jgi:hypothetical protein
VIPPLIPLDAEPDPAQIAEAIAVIKGGLGKAEIEFAASVSAPLFWVLRDHAGERLKNGSVFFSMPAKAFLPSRPAMSSSSVSPIRACPPSFKA